MATNTYVALATQTLTTATSTVTFTSIPQTYTDLVLVTNGIESAYLDNIALQFNNDNAGTNYSYTQLVSNGSAVSSARQASASALPVGLIGTEQGMTIAHIMNYSNATSYKSIIGRGSVTNSSVRLYSGIWRGTAAITTLTIATGSNMSVGSTFTLYGISANAGSYSASATGGTVTTDAGYIYHTFNSSGTFTPSTALTCDVLVVGGGGGGQNGWYGGGGGGGQYTINTGYSAASGTPVTVTIGQGGPYGASGTTGTSSSFGAYTSIGGNGGAGQIGGTSGNGFAGGTYYSSGSYLNATAGGGGGSTQVGYAGASNVPGNGGAGSTYYSANSSKQYAGGGAGGAGGNTVSGGVGAYGGGNGGAGGGNTTQATAGADNTGGGGGGGGYTSPYYGGNGGSGVVIVRYPR